MKRGKLGGGLGSEAGRAGLRPAWLACVVAAGACLSLFVAHRVISSAEGPKADAPGLMTTATDGEGALLETGGPARPTPTPPMRSPVEVKIVSYNIRWRGGEELEKLIGQLRDDPEIGRADIVGLQEVDRNRKRTGNVNTARRMADALGMYYAWAAPPAEPDETEEPTGVAILSKYPLTEVERFVLPNEGPNQRRRAALGATVRFNDAALRVYSVHAETRIKMEKKMEQLQAVVDDIRCHPRATHVVVLGDFNTIKPKDVRGARRLFAEAGFQTPFPDDEQTFKTYIFQLKLDWIWLRGPVNTTGYGINRRLELSDHWPLWLTARLDPPKQRPDAVRAEPAYAHRAEAGQCAQAK